jgi:carboxynorspermidine decarboxylase
MKEINTPYYLIDENKLKQNLEKVSYLKKNCPNLKVLLALKCYSTWSTFPLISSYLDGTTSSSVFEARLGYEKFGKETHAYCVGFTDRDVREISYYADKMIFNSETQLQLYRKQFHKCNIGIRLNPGISCSDYDLADPCREQSRLGVANKDTMKDILQYISGAMFHYNCDNENIDNIETNLNYLITNYSDIIDQLSWVSLGGGMAFTKPNFNLNKFCQLLNDFSNRFKKITIYLEPGEAIVSNIGQFIVTVVDIIHRDNTDIAIVDASVEAHMLDMLTYRLSLECQGTGYEYVIAGRSCLAGDIFGKLCFQSKLSIGDQITIEDTNNFTVAGYSIVKKNWFNGLAMPSIVVKKMDGFTEIKQFDYTDFIRNLA